MKEQVDAGYIEVNTRWKQIPVQSRRAASSAPARSGAHSISCPLRGRRAAAGYTPDTIPYRRRISTATSSSETSYGGYDNMFFSGGAKYSVTKNLVLQLAASQSIGRPDYNNLAGAHRDQRNELQRVTLPNPDLKPETSDKYFASIQYYIEPAGTLSVSAYTAESGKHGHEPTRDLRRGRRATRTTPNIPATRFSGRPISTAPAKSRASRWSTASSSSSCRASRAASASSVPCRARHSRHPARQHRAESGQRRHSFQQPQIQSPAPRDLGVRALQPRSPRRRRQWQYERSDV